jgi:SAM-dependent methyltransferase/GT2 family glycosyltransferase
MKKILLVQLEFDTWDHARAWSYTGGYSFYDGLTENGHSCTLLPAISGRKPDAPDSFIYAAPELLRGETFDEAWVWCVHTSYDKIFWDWLKTVAPVRVGVVMESLTHSEKEAQEFPHLLTRQEEVYAQLSHCTHALLADEFDIAGVEHQIGIPATWNVPMVPETSVRHDDAPDLESAPKAVFIGSTYGDRRRYLGNAELGTLLIRPQLPESNSDLPQHFADCHLSARQKLLNREMTPSALVAFTTELRALRKNLFSLTLDGIRSGYCSVNLPSIVKCYPGRVFEAIASATPVAAWRIPDRVLCERLFGNGEEISLFATEAELVCRLQELRQSREKRENQVIGARNTLLVRHTSRIRMCQYQRWIDAGESPDFMADQSFKPSITESRFYRSFFSHDPYWSAPKPNDDEQARWEKIRGFVSSVRELVGRPLAIAEIGCGRGWLANLCSQFGQVTAVEPVGDVIAHARATFPGIEFMTGDATLLGYLGYQKKFDLVICSEVIEHIPADKKKAFANNLVKLTATGHGYLIITTPRKDIRDAWEQEHGTPNQPVEDWMTEAEVCSLFETTGCRSLLLERAFLLDIYQIWLFAGPPASNQRTASVPINFFGTTRAPYYISAPDYRQSSAGTRVLHYLCHALNELGEEAYLIAPLNTHPNLRTPLLTPQILQSHFLSGRTPIAVYPEIIFANPFQCPTVARWLLNKPGHIGGSSDINPNELLFHFTDMCLPQEALGQRLHLPTVDRSIFNNQNNPHHFNRSDEYYYANKVALTASGINTQKHPNAISLGLEVKLTPEELAQRLRQASVLYCYEPSGLIYEALACGCPVLIVDGPYWNVHGSPEILSSLGIRLLSEDNAFERAKFDLALRYDPELEPLIDDRNSIEQVKAFVTKTQSVEKARPSTNVISNKTDNTLPPSPWLTPADRRKSCANSAIRKLKAIYFPTIFNHDDLTNISLFSFEEACNAWADQRELIDQDAITLFNQANTPTLPKFQLLVRLVPGSESQLGETLRCLQHQLYEHWRLDIVTTLPRPSYWEDIFCIDWHTVTECCEIKFKIDSLCNSEKHDWFIELPLGAILDPLCLWRLANEINLHPKICAFFADDNIIDETGVCGHIRFKPGVNPEWLRSADLAGPVFVRRDVWLAAGGASLRDGSPWFSQLLRIAEKFGWSSIRHVPDVLISYTDAFPRATESCLLGLLDHLKNKGIDGEIVPVTGQSWCIRYPLETPPQVSIAIISRGQLDLLTRCFNSIIEKTTYLNYDITCVVPDERDDLDLNAWLANVQQSAAPAVHVIRTNKAANYSERCNAAVKASSEEFVLLIREEAVIIQEKWLEELVRTGLQPDIAAVSPCLIAPGTSKIQEAGSVIGLRGLVGSPYQGEAKLGEPGYLDSLRVARDVCALSGSCILVRSAAYLAVGGMDEVALGDNYADTDLCQKLRSPTQRLIYQPLATVVCGGATSLDIESDLETEAQKKLTKAHAAKVFSQRWLTHASVDPFWNPNLSLADVKPTPETEFHAQWQYLPSSAPRVLARNFWKGESFFRIDSALGLSRKAGLATECYWPQDKREPSAAELLRLAPDTVIVHQYLKNPQLAALQDWSTSPDRPFVVYTIDDLMTDMAKSNSLRTNIPANSQTRLKYALERCDRLVTSTDFLAERYRHFIADIRVVPNRLVGETWLPLQSHKRTGKKPRIGWAGGRTHLDDLLLLKETIEQTRERSGLGVLRHVPG